MQPRGLFQRAPLPPAAVLGGAIASKAAEIQCERFAADRSNCLNPADAPGGERGERRGRMVGTARKDSEAGRGFGGQVLPPGQVGNQARAAAEPPGRDGESGVGQRGVKSGKSWLQAVDQKKK